jgi:O-antigen/teichoic acid export membrane protein
MVADDAQDTTQGFARGMLLLALANAAYVVTAYVVTTVTARVLGPGDFGAFGVVMAWITVLTALLVKGLSTTVSREMARGTVDQPTAWRAGRSLGIRLSVALAVVGAVGSPIFASAFGASGLSELFAIGALGALTFGTNAVLLAWPTGQRDYRRQAIAQVAYALARVAFVVGGAIAFGLEGAVVGYVVAPLVSSLSILSRVPAATGSIAAVRSTMLPSILPLALTSIAVSAWFVIDVFAVSAVFGERSAELGAYVAFGTIAHVPFFLLQATSVAMVPALAAAIDGDARRFAIRRTMTDTVVLVAAPVFVLMTAGDAAARAVFGSEFRVDGLVTAPLALATGAVTILAALVAVDAAIGRLRAALVVNGFGLAVLALVCLRIGEDSQSVTDVAWGVAAVSLGAMVVLAVLVLASHRALFELRRAGAGLAVGAVAALPPLVFQDDVARTVVAAASGIAWIAIIVRFQLIDLRRAGPPD